MKSGTVKLIAAAAIGFAAGILLAPKSGKDTREDLKHKALDAKDFAEDKVEYAKGLASDTTNAVKKGVNEVGDEARGMLKSVRRSADTAKDEAQKLGSEAKTRATRVQKNAEKRLR